MARKSALSSFAEGFTRQWNEEDEKDRKRKAEERADRADQRAQEAHEQTKEVNAINLTRLKDEEKRRASMEAVERQLAEYYANNTERDENGNITKAPSMLDATGTHRDLLVQNGLIKEARAMHKEWRDMWRGQLEDSKLERSEKIDDAARAFSAGNGKIAAELYNTLYPNGKTIDDIVTDKDGKVFAVKGDQRIQLDSSPESFIKRLSTFKSADAMVSRFDAEFQQRIAAMNANSQRISANAAASNAQTNAGELAIKQEVQKRTTAAIDLQKKAAVAASAGDHAQAAALRRQADAEVGAYKGESEAKTVVEKDDLTGAVKERTTYSNPYAAAFGPQAAAGGKPLDPRLQAAFGQPAGQKPAAAAPAAPAAALPATATQAAPQAAPPPAADPAEAKRQRLAAISAKLAEDEQLPSIFAMPIAERKQRGLPMFGMAQGERAWLEAERQKLERELGAAQPVAR